MNGQTYSKLNPGDTCYIIIGPEDNPTGYYDGRVLAVTPGQDFVSGKANPVSARIEDPDAPMNLAFTEPAGSYRVVPTSPDTLMLVTNLRRLEDQITLNKLAIGSLENTVDDVVNSLASALGCEVVSR